MVIPQQAEVAQGVPVRLRSRIFVATIISTGRVYPRRNPWYSFSRVESTHMAPSEGATEKIPSDTTGNRSRDRLTSSAAP